MTKTFLLLFSAAMITVAQPVSVGVIGGVPITDAFQTFRGNTSAYATHTNRYVVGPTVQFNLPARFSVEVDGLYRRLGFQFDQTSPTTVSTRTVANAWEFPALIKFAIVPGPIRPFIGVGASFRHISGVDTIRTVINNVGTATNTTVNPAPEFSTENDIGGVATAGGEFKIGWLRIAPQFRYTRWGSEAFRDPVNSFLHSNRNQGDFLLGLTF
jgi:hypothetical protein